MLITIDTLRADHLPCYGYEKNTAPNICKLENEGIFFENAISQAPWTLPAHASIMTGVYPHEHGADDDFTPITMDLPVLPELLKEQKFFTGGFVSNHYIGEKYRFDRGFDIFDSSNFKDYLYKSSKNITDLGINLLNSVDNNPFFFMATLF